MTYRRFSILDTTPATVATLATLATLRPAERRPVTETVATVASVADLHAEKRTSICEACYGRADEARQWCPYPSQCPLRPGQNRWAEE